MKKYLPWISLLFCISISLDSLAQSDSTSSTVDSSATDLSLQIPVDTVWITFTKGDRSSSPDSTLFDIIQIQNTQTTAIQGNLIIEMPKDWSLISQAETTISLGPGESFYIPFRASMPDQLVGGYSYIVSAILETSDQKYTQSLYVTVPQNSDWGMELLEQNIFFNTLYDYVEYDYRLYNNGNAEEIIKVDYDVGKMLDLPDLDNTDKQKYYVIPAHSDTTIKHKIKFQKGLSDFEKERYENNFRESMVVMNASTSEKKENRKVWVTKLNSEYNNHKGIYNYVTPLNIEWQTYNLLSSVSPRFNLRAFGKILFKNEKQLEYNVAALSLPYSGSYSNVSFSKNMFFRVLYKTPETKLFLSSNLGGYSLMNSYGMGISLKQELFSNMRAEAIVTRDRFLPITSASLTVEYDLYPELTARLGMGFYDDAEVNQIATSILAGSRFSIANKHRFDIDLALSFNTFRESVVLPQEEQKIGFSYRFRYNVSLTKFNLSIYSLNKALNYFRNSNNFVTNVNGSYVFNAKNRINLNFYNNYYLLNYYPYRFLRQDSWTRNIYGQLLYVRPLSPKLFLTVGPEYRYSYRDIYDITLDYNKQLENLFYGGYFSLTYRINQYTNITPNLRLGMAQTNYQDQLNAIDIQTELQPAIRVGLNYAGKYLRVLAFYQQGPLNISDQALISDRVIPNQQSYQVRPYYERYFYDKRLRLSAFVNYIYLMPARRDLFNWSVMADVYLDGGWELGVSNNMYTNKYVNSEQNLVANRGLNIFLKVKKSFAIQQPRVHFYNLEILYFKDLNGNGIMDKNDLPYPNIKTVIDRNKEVDANSSLDQVFVSQHLVSNPEGEIMLENIPDGEYTLQHYMLTNSENLFFVYGNVQELTLTSNQKLFVPLTESYKIKGKVMIQRDPNSDKGIIDIGEIRVSAISDSGETYFGLTDDYGQFTIHVPPGHSYEISVNQVLGKGFELEKDTYRVDMIKVKTVNVDFYFIENKRGVNMNGENLFDFNLTPENN